MALWSALESLIASGSASTVLGSQTESDLVKLPSAKRVSRQGFLLADNQPPSFVAGDWFSIYRYGIME